MKKHYAKSQKVTRTRPHETFSEVSEGEVWNKFAEIGFRGKYSYELTRDLANYYSYERLGENPHDSFLNVKEQMAEEIIWIDKHGNDEQKAFAAAKFIFHKNVQHFIASLDWEKFTGSTPLDKAASVIALLSSLGKNYQAGKDKIDGENTVPIFTDEHDENEDDPFDMEESQGGDGEGDEEGEDGNGDGQDGEGQEGEDGQDGDGNGEGEGDETDGQGKQGKGKPKGKPDPKRQEEYGNAWSHELSEMMTEVVEHHRKIVETTPGYFLKKQGMRPEVVAGSFNNEQEQLLENLSLLAKRGEIKAHKEQKKIFYNRMTEFSQVNNLANISQVGMPHFDYKLATKQPLVRRADQSTKQSLILLIDASGSMDCYPKMQWVKAIILNRLQAVINNEAELFIVFFEDHAFINDKYSRTSEYGYAYGNGCFVQHVKTKKQAIDLAKLEWLPRFCGGDTDVQKSIKQVEQAIEKGKIGKHHLQGVKPQIVVMNDGQDYIDPHFTPKYPTHGFILGQDNKNMKKICANSGGIYERFL